MIRTLSRIEGSSVDESTRSNSSKYYSNFKYQLNNCIDWTCLSRSYWKNYFESTDGVVWVVDSADTRRLADCARELRALLHEERLAGATLLVLANKADLPGALSLKEIREVRT